MALQRTPALPYCAAVLRVSALIAAFDTAYAVWPRSPARLAPLRGVHDAASAAGDQVRQRELGREHRALQVDAHRRVPDVGVHVADVQVTSGRQVGGGGVVVQDVQPAEPVDGLLDERLHRLRVPEVDPYGVGPPALSRRCGPRPPRPRRRRGRPRRPMLLRDRGRRRTRVRCPMPTRSRCATFPCRRPAMVPPSDASEDPHVTVQSSRSFSCPLSQEGVARRARRAVLRPPEPAALAPGPGPPARVHPRAVRGSRPRSASTRCGSPSTTSSTTATSPSRSPSPRRSRHERPGRGSGLRSWSRRCIIRSGSPKRQPWWT